MKTCTRAAAACFGVVVALTRGAAAAPREGPQSPPRALPDYDGRGMPDAKPDDGVGTWTGRVVLFPLYLTSEYVIRRPIGAALAGAERAGVLDTLSKWFATDPKLSVTPAFVLRSGFLPDVGAKVTWHDAVATHNELRVRVDGWPVTMLAGEVVDRYELGGGRALELRFDGTTRPDFVFYGAGPSAVAGGAGRYRATRFEGSAAEEVRFGVGSEVRGSLGLRHVAVRSGHFGDDPALDVAAARGAFAIPFGFDRAYLEPYARLDVRLDTRARGATTGSSVGLGAHCELGGDVEHAGDGWARYAATLRGTLDLDDHGRLLSLHLAALFADPLAASPVPFTELVSLGGGAWMHGFGEGRLVDRSAAVAALAYAWPIAPWGDGVLDLAVGDVFGAHLDGIRPGLLRLSPSIGVSVGHEAPLELLVGLGTQTFEQGARLDSFQITFGVPRSF